MGRPRIRWRDQALECLERAYKLRSSNNNYIVSHIEMREKNQAQWTGGKKDIFDGILI